MSVPYENSLQCVAMLFTKTGNTDTLSGVTPWALEDEMLRYAAERCMPGESEAAAITRLARHDEVAKALCRAAYHADDYGAALNLLHQTARWLDKLSPNAAASLRERTPSLPKIDERWLLTVLSARCSFRAISPFENPMTTIPSTCFSRAESAGRATCSRSERGRTSCPLATP